MLRLVNKSLRSNVGMQLTRSMSFWAHVPMGPPDPIMGVADAHNKDPFEGKINVGIGAYRTNEGKPWVLPSVAKAQQRLIDQELNMEYAGIAGVPAFVEQAKKLVYGGSDALAENRVAALQSLSGTGALRLSAEFLARNSPEGQLPTVMLPNPTWGNHFPIYQHAGLKTATYRYWHPETLGLDIDGMLADLKNAEGPTAVLLHACAHNPTGVDPTTEQWQMISDVIKEAGHFVIFDNAYQGFASGDANVDAGAIELFLREGHLLSVCQSFAKNFGLYGQRVGAYSVVCETPEEAAAVESQIKIIARGTYSTPPIHGARLVSTVLEDPELNAEWLDEIRQMSGRIIEMRVRLKEELEKAGSTLNWDHITNQIGMFSYTGMTVEQCKKITDDHHVYLTSNGRISMAGVTTGNVAALAKAMHDVTK